MKTSNAAKLLGSRGGHARRKKLTTEQRKEIATKASHSTKAYKDKLKKASIVF